MAPAQFKAQSAPSVTLDVVVSDKSGTSVAGLDPKDFNLLDNKKQLSLASVREVNGMNSAENPPVEVIWLIDNIVSDFETLANLRRNLTEYLQKSGDQLPLPVSLVFLTDQGLKRQGQSTRDPHVLLANLANNPSVQQATQLSSGYERLMEVRQKSLTALDVLAVDLHNKPGRKLVIWISPGWPAFEAETSQKSARERQELFTFIVGISTLLHESNITLYSVDPTGASGSRRSSAGSFAAQDYSRSGNNQQTLDAMGGNNQKYKDYLKGVTSPKQADNAHLLLQVLAAQTGGKVVFGRNDMAQMIAECMADARTFYELTFNLPPVTQANEYHGFQVQIGKPGLKTRTRIGLYAQP